MDEKDEGAQMEPLLPAVRACFISHVRQWKNNGMMLYNVMRKRVSGVLEAAGYTGGAHYSHHSWKTSFLNYSFITVNTCSPLV